MKYIYQAATLSYSYEKDKSLFTDLTFNLPKTGITILTGKNGAGKTTFCRLLTGLNKGYQGSLRLNDKEISVSSQADIFDKVLYVKQDLTGSLMGVTAEEDLKIWQNRFQEPDSVQKAALRREALAAMGIENLIDTPVWELSYGQRRRIMLSVLPLFFDKYWILDEPSASLDELGVEKLVHLLKKKAENDSGALIVTHRPDLLEELFVKSASNQPTNIFAIRNKCICSQEQVSNSLLKT